MTRINRRTVLTAAGAGLLLPAYDWSHPERERRYARDDPRGPCENYGELATKTEPHEGPGVNATFNPQYLCVLYVRFRDDKTLKVRTAYVDLPPSSSDDESVKRLARPILEAMHRNEHASIQAKRKGEDFEAFGSDEQLIIVVFIDNDPADIAFDDRLLATHGHDFVIRFTPFSSRNPDATNIYKNNAFLGLRPLTFDRPKPLRTERAYRLEFWNTDHQGNPITGVIEGQANTYYLFSMNIHLKIAMKTTGGQNYWVPLILDPDTGNMGFKP
jgi:hypothetical protein